MTRLIGIDLGTTNSLCAIFEGSAPRLIPNAHGDVLTPSVVGVLDDGQIIVGSPARELRVTRPENCASCFKRWMGTDKTVELGGRTFSATELSSLILRSLKEDAEAHLGTALTDAVITVPAYFNDHQRKATKLAGELAGLNVRRILNEPTAAALTYGFHDRQAEKRLLVIDLGGGTFDVTLMEICDGMLEIIATAGESFLGGEDFTDRLVGWTLQQHHLTLELAEVKQPLRVARLRQECEQAKRAFLTDASAVVRLPNEQGEFPPDAPAMTVTREQFAQITDGLLRRIAGPIGRALRDGRCSPGEVNEVILVGGATRMSVLRTFVQDFLKTEPICTFNPDEVVALGAAVQAVLIADDHAVDDMVMTDVCPFTLGVGVSKEFGGRIADGYYLPVIHRNTTIPVSREQVVETLHANQREVNVRIYQGESRKVKDNLLLGELKVTGIPPGPKGTPVQVRFTYDLNGILEVEAYVPSTGQKQQTVVTEHVRGLSKKEVEAAVRKMEELKFYPRDELRNQALVLYCERLVGEVSPFHRDQFEEAIDAFEQAMSSGNREWFEFARTGLLLMLSQLGFEYDETRVQNESRKGDDGR